MAELTITVSFKEPGTCKSDELISRQTGIPYNNKSMAAVDALKLQLGDTVVRWREQIKQNNNEDSTT